MNTCKLSEQLPAVVFTAAPLTDFNSCAETVLCSQEASLSSARSRLEAVPRHTRKESCRAQILCSPRSPLYSQRHLWWKTIGVLLQPLSPPPAESWSSTVPPYLADTLEEFWLGQGHHLSDTVSHAVFRDPLSYPPGSFRLALHGTAGLSSASLPGHRLARGRMSLKPAQPGPPP